MLNDANSVNPAAAIFLTSQEASKYLRIGLTSLYRHIRLGEIPTERVGRGGSYRFRKADLDHWLKESAQNSHNNIVAQNRTICQVKNGAKLNGA